MNELSVIDKRHLARALFREATGHVPSEPDWSHVAEKHLETLIAIFRGMIDGDPKMCALIVKAGRKLQAQS
jgi:hypothetical protein